MLRASFRRTPRARLLRALALLVSLVLLIDLLSLLTTIYHIPPSPPPKASSERIFIASIHWNNENVIRSAWSAALLNLTETLGATNIYISILESGSWDDTKGALRALDSSLASLFVPRTIILDPTTHAEEIARAPSPSSIPADQAGWINITQPNPKNLHGAALRRIPYLSRLRNRALEPLHTQRSTQGITYDRILFLNDVAFSTHDILTLLSTREGAYAAACALDFAHPPHYYDTFALRDGEGYEAVTSYWPYFRSRRNRAQMLQGREVEVRSCWNGVVAMDARPF